MPKSFEEATVQGVRRGWRDFLINFLGQMGKGFAWCVLGVVFIYIALWVMDSMWDGFTSPFRGVWSWTSEKVGGGVDWVTGWLPEGDTVVDPAAVGVTEEMGTEVLDEPGVICRNTGGWNWFCK